MIANNDYSMNNISHHILWSQFNDWYSVSKYSEDLSIMNLGNSGLYQLISNDYFYFFRNYYKGYYLDNNINNNLTVLFINDEIDEKNSFSFHSWKSENKIKLLFGNLESSYCLNYECSVSGNATLWKYINLTMIQLLDTNTNSCKINSFCQKISCLDGFQSDQIEAIQTEKIYFF